MNAQWLATATDKKTGGPLYLYLFSADLANVKLARKRATTKAVAKWKAQGLTVKQASVRCVG